jgi:hypothetical protein
MQKIEPRPSVASKKLYERSEFRVAFDLAFAFLNSRTLTKNCPDESSESEIQ